MDGEAKKEKNHPKSGSWDKGLTLPGQFISTRPQDPFQPTWLEGTLYTQMVLAVSANLNQNILAVSG